MMMPTLRAPTFRVIARLDVKGLNLIKGVQYDGLRQLGDPSEFAVRYYTEGADELVYLDAVASLYGRNHLSELLKNVSRSIFIPMTVGGGVRSVEDARQLFESGADKIAINTAAVARPNLIRELADTFGSQAVVVSIAAKRKEGPRWEAYTEWGREPTSREVLDWACEAQYLGAGEILLTSIDRDGTKSGLDLELVRHVSPHLTIPLIVGGGASTKEDLPCAVASGADAIAIGSALHYGLLSVSQLKEYATSCAIPVRKV